MPDDRSWLSRMSGAVGDVVGAVSAVSSSVFTKSGETAAPPIAAAAPSSSPASSAEAAIAASTGADTEAPLFVREQPIVLWTDFKSQRECIEAIRLLDLGYLQFAAFLTEQMLWNPRLRGIINTRLAGLLGTAIRWEPGRNNDVGRRAVKAIGEDWPLIAPAPTRKQQAEWGLFIGTSFAQKHWYRSRSTGRRIPRLEVFHPSWVTWNWGPRLYQVMTLDGTQWVESPSLTVPGDEWRAPATGIDVSRASITPASPMQWVVHEPFGQHSWRRGLIHSAWSAWLAHDMARRDMARSSEKLGLAMIKLKYPKLSKEQGALQALLRALKRLNSEAVIPLEQRGPGEGGSFEAEPFEYGGTGMNIIQTTKDSNATDLAVLFLGHNLTTEAKGGSYAAANVGDLIRSDIKTDDASAENTTMHGQVVSDWAEVNFGDRELAPRAIYETDPPAINLTAAQTLSFVATAIVALSKSGIKGIDFGMLLERFRIPVGAEGVTIEQLATTTPLPAGTDALVSNIKRQFESLAVADKQDAMTALQAWLVRCIESLEGK